MLSRSCLVGLKVHVLESELPLELSCLSLVVSVALLVLATELSGNGDIGYSSHARYGTSGHHSWLVEADTLGKS